MTHQETFIQIYQEHIHRRGADQLLAWLQSVKHDKILYDIANCCVIIFFPLNSERNISLAFSFTYSKLSTKKALRRKKLCLKKF